MTIRRKPIRRRSAKNRARAAEVRPWREALCERVSRCEHCLLPTAPEYLDVDEIARGSGHRQKALDQPYAVLVVRRTCHRLIQDWPRAKRLALLLLARGSDYDLEAYWRLIGRRTPEQAEVDRFVRDLTQGT